MSCISLKTRISLCSGARLPRARSSAVRSSRPMAAASGIGRAVFQFDVANLTVLGILLRDAQCHLPVPLGCARQLVPANVQRDAHEPGPERRVRGTSSRRGTRGGRSPARRRARPPCLPASSRTPGRSHARGGSRGTRRHRCCRSGSEPRGWRRDYGFSLPRVPLLHPSPWAKDITPHPASPGSSM